MPYRSSLSFKLFYISILSNWSFHIVRHASLVSAISLTYEYKKVSILASFYDLKHYIAHHVNRGRCLISEKGKTLAFSRSVYDGRGNYTDEFNNFVERLISSGEFLNLYIEGDAHSFAQLIHSRFEFDYCVRCADPIPTPQDVVLAPPSCNLCPMQEIQPSYQGMQPSYLDQSRA